MHSFASHGDRVVIPNAAEILDYLRTTAGKPLRARELAAGMRVPEPEHGEFFDLLEHLEEQGILYGVQKQRYAAPDRINLVVGRISATRKGAAFLVPEDASSGPDIYIDPDSRGSAQDGDRVVVRIESRRRGERAEGTVIKVLERRRTTVVGTFHAGKPERDDGRGYGFVVPEDTKISKDVYVAAGDAATATDGDVVVIKVRDWGSDKRGPSGSVQQVLGRRGDPGVDVLAIVFGHELAVDFPDEVTAEAEAIQARGLQGSDLAGRTDLRDTLIFTIDPADAKDHDDALSIRQIEGGRYEVGVHIADVSHYVREGAPLDLEALQRGTSTYLVDRVIPMLPHALSSNLCSLRPDEDRLALSLLLTIDGAGAVLEHGLVRSVIRSRHKLSYEHAQAVLDGTTSVAPDTDDALRLLARLSAVLRARRAARGSIDFDLPEARVVLNRIGEPTDIQKVERLETHKLIEDFMLLANETIARMAADAKIPFIYRIHEPPDPTRLETLREFVATLGYTLGKGSPRDLQQLLARLEGKPESPLISTVVLRSMKQARYSVENTGHFGLATRHYTHFTSPIRRYPDLIVHRVMGHVFIDGNRPKLTEDAASDIARISSERERIAVTAERDSIDLKKVEFMEQHLGQSFDGTISGVTAFGLFVLLDAFFVEGLVHVSSLDDDYYMFVEEQYTLIGEHTRRRFRLGDRLRVQVSRVDIEERKIDFIVEGQKRAGRPGSRPRGRDGSSPNPPSGRTRKGEKRGKNG